MATVFDWLTSETTTTTTTSTIGGDSSISNTGFLQSATIIPYIAEEDITFVGRGLLPDRDVYFFFDDTNIHQYIQRPNRIYLQGTVKYKDLSTNGVPSYVSVGSSNSATIIFSTADPDTGNTLILVSNVTGVFEPTRTLTIENQGSKVIDSYQHYSGTASASGTANTVYLANDASYMANDYWGTDGSNTIFIVAGTSIREYGNVSGFNNVTLALTVSNSFTANTDNTSRYSIGALDGSQTTDDYGYVAGTFVVPEDSTQAFRSGERVFKITDSPTDLDDEADTYASTDFYSAGLALTASKIGTKTPTVTTTTTVSKTKITGTKKTFTPQPLGPALLFHGGHPDPLAQTFFIDENIFPNGIFLTAISLFFKRKDANNIPVSVEVRPVVNGYPSSYEVVPHSTVTRRPSRITTTDTPDVTDDSSATKFDFRSPLYLPPGEWSFVVKSSSPTYAVYTAEMGQTIVNSTNIASKQPYVGSLFKSQNGSTWTAYQSEDMMFRLHRAQFVNSGTVVYKNRFNAKKDRPAAVDLLYGHTVELVMANTSVAYTHSTDGGSTFKAYRPDTYYSPTSRFHITGVNDYQISATLETTDNAVSPILGYTQTSVIAIQKLINNGNITNAHVVITDGGSGYTVAQNHRA